MDVNPCWTPELVAAWHLTSHER